VLAPGHFRVLQQNMAYNHRQERTVSSGEVYVVAQQAAGPNGDIITVTGDVVGYRPVAP
jgi:hypothetical protein